MEEVEIVRKDLCKVIHKQVDEKFESINTCIKEIRDAVNKMQEIASGTKEIINILMEDRNQREPHVIAIKSKVWEAPWFKYIAITACIVTIVIIGAAIGNNMIDKYIQAMQIVNGG